MKSRHPIFCVFRAGWLQVVILLLAAPCWAQDLSLGIEAYRAQAYQQAHDVLMPYAQRGEPEAQRLVGVMYLLGQGVEQDLDAAQRWIRGSAQLGNPQAQELLSFMYNRGAGLPRDPVQAYVWLKLASQSVSDPAHSDGIQTIIARLLGEMDENDRRRARSLSREYYYQYVAPFL